MKEPVIVVDASGILTVLRWENEHAHSDWESKCRNLRNSYKQKTSRMIKGDKEYVYTKWYKIIDDIGSLESIGDKEPDWKKLLPPEPKHKEIPAVEWKGHLIMEKKDYEANLKQFKEYLAFGLEDCANLVHPLYKNPDKALKGVSVRKGRGAAERSQLRSGTESGVDKVALMKKCQDLGRSQKKEEEDEDEEF